MFGFLKKTVEVVSKETLQNAVAAFGRKDADLHDELVRIAVGSQVTAQQLYWFIPTALFHILFPEVETIDGSYTIVYPDQSKKVFLFSKDPIYNAVYEYLKTVCASLDNESVYRILGYSSEFNVVNQALKARDEANLEANLENLLLSGPIYIMV